MPKLQPIQREPASTSDREGQKILAVNSNGGVRVSGPAARINSQQAAGVKVAGQMNVSGGNAAPPSKKQGRVTPAS